MYKINNAACGTEKSGRNLEVIHGSWMKEFKFAELPSHFSTFLKDNSTDRAAPMAVKVVKDFSSRTYISRSRDFWQEFNSEVRSSACYATITNPY